MRRSFERLREAVGRMAMTGDCNELVISDHPYLVGNNVKRPKTKTEIQGLCVTERQHKVFGSIKNIQSMMCTLFTRLEVEMFERSRY